MSSWFMASADEPTGETGLLIPEGFTDLCRMLTVSSEAAPPLSLRAAIEARLLLQSEIENAVTARA